MNEQSTVDVAVIGGGIVGLAAARAFLLAHPEASLAVLEAEPELAAHQTGHNSGVIHSGLYYRPGSLKAACCAEGREALYRFCEQEAIPFERCGKVVVAVAPGQLPALDELERRGRTNGIEGLRRLTPEALREIEPHVAGCAGLQVSETGIVDFRAVAERYAEHIRARGGTIRLPFRVERVRGAGEYRVLSSPTGEIAARHIINCAGLRADRVARLCGAHPELKIIPFRGEYYRLRPGREELVRNLVYPVPDPRFPFLGVHFTRMIGGGVEAGPNAVLAFKREGYTRRDFSLRDTLEMLGYSGFVRMGRRYWRTGLDEFRRSFSRRRFADSLRKLVPEIRDEDILPHGAGVRAQAVRPDGALLDDFCLLETPHALHVLNAPSPAATASLAIGRILVERANACFSL